VLIKILSFSADKKDMYSLDQNIKILPLIEGIQRDSFQSFNPFSKEMQTILPALILLLRSSPRKLTGKDLAQLWDKLGHLQNHLTAISLDSFSVGIGAEDPIRNLIQHLTPDGDHFIKAKA
jgi:hypothetical protein